MGDAEEVPVEFQDWLNATFKPRSNSGPRIRAPMFKAKRNLADVALQVRKEIVSKTNVHDAEIIRLLEVIYN